ncbi:ATP-binding protein [Vibrio sp. 10N.261.46.E12]|uniref:ATP-binding protein n=1 Tax=unclassified Vibrio TaxID=2614977 RepID=UPI0009768C73|nr:MULTISPECIES: ATP-binding protein [unclassified Vibrio]OMO36475.1 hypothetical protein BH584_04105 [Vibrio sp. 10N.261.45.E1]PMJ22141.1 hypothetical protein BCU27_17145 [Vibrio sp. 10N.286.45.B6]PML97415.1 hypothetical protein BCT66_21055 [Vibrio sp. 10N.261.49.E11]PMM76547.1 hypothetical protein BCT48_01910 [Vibrio sp. 10N.261.46.F12]PMM82494.1 hypothetical protein BCT46_14175 [Vibrio sp. 10N.261.46.E8]
MNAHNSQSFAPINIRQFLISARDAGYELAEGFSEIVDNAIQAQASRIDILIEEKNGEVNAVYFCDNGTGMDAVTLRKYLRLGESGSWLSDKGISKYGVGAKMSAYNTGLRIDAYSRKPGESDLLHTHYDLEELMAADEACDIPEPTPSVPNLLTLPADANTIISWSKLDKWPTQRLSTVTTNLHYELGRIFRKFINMGLKLTLNGQDIKSFDPTLQLSGTLNDEILSKSYLGEDAPLKHFGPTFICQNEPLMEVDGEVATLTVVLAPEEVTRRAGMGGDALAKALKLKSNQGNVSFLRSGREIGYSNIPGGFGRGVLAEDRFISIEVSFSPKFDTHFGTRMVKRGVEAKGTMRKILKEKLKIYVGVANKMLRQRWDDAPTSVDFDQVEVAVERLETLFNKTAALTGNQEDQQNKMRRLVELATESGLTDDEVNDYCNRKIERPFILNQVSNLPHNTFLDFEQNADQTIIRVNEEHSIFRTVWKPLYEVTQATDDDLKLLNPADTAKFSLQSLNLMLIAFARIELSTDEWAEELNHLIDQVELKK